MRTLLAILVLALVGLAGWLLWSGEPRQATKPASPATVKAEAQAEAQVDPEAPIEAKAGEKPAESSDRTRLEASRSQPDGSTVELRVLRFGTDEPVSTVEVFFLPPGFSRNTIPEDARKKGRQDPEYLHREFGHKTLTDAEGRCMVPIGKRNTSVVARHGELYGSTYLYPETKTPHTLYLRTDFELRVHVLDARGLAAEGVTVTVASKGRNEDSTRWQLGTTNAKGELAVAHFQTRAHGRKSFPLEIYAKPVGGESPRVEFDAVAPPKEPIELWLPPTGSIEVLVQKASGEPYDARHFGHPSLVIAVFHKKPSRREARNNGSLHGTFDEKGRALFPHVVLGKHISLSLPSLLRDPLVLAGPTAQQPRLVVPIRIDAEAVVFEGRALDGEGNPLAKVVIQLTCKFQRGTSSHGGLTDDEGNFWIPMPWLREGQEVQINLSTAGRGGQPRLLAKLPRPWTVMPGANRIGELILGEDPLVLSGKVIFPNEARSRRLSWYCEREVSQRHWRQFHDLKTTWQEDGSFEIRGPAEPGAQLRLRFQKGQYRQIAPLEFRPGAISSSN